MEVVQVNEAKRIMLTLELPDRHRAFRELAIVLKRLLRAYGMKCIRIVPASPEAIGCVPRGMADALHVEPANDVAGR